jgi:hypothetical protein
MANTMHDTIVVDGVTYTRAAAKGSRAVVVLDRGWIFAGDVTEKEGRIFLDRAVHVFSWPGGGFAAMVADPKKTKADLRPCAPLNFPTSTEIFRCPVEETWGL